MSSTKWSGQVDLNHRSPPSKGGRDSGLPYALSESAGGRAFAALGLLAVRRRTALAFEPCRRARASARRQQRADWSSRQDSNLHPRDS